MNEVCCPICDSFLTEEVEWPLMKCQDCKAYFDLDDQQEKISKIPKKQRFDDDSERNF